MIAYAIGRAASDNFLARYGHWIGYSPRRRDRASQSSLKSVASPQSAAISVPNSNHAYLRS
jgi:hypothetical protein